METPGASRETGGSTVQAVTPAPLANGGRRRIVEAVSGDTIGPACRVPSRQRVFIGVIATRLFCGHLFSAPKARPKIAQGKRPQGASPWVRALSERRPEGRPKKHRAGRLGTAKGRLIVPLPLWPQSAAPTGAKKAEEHEQKWRITQGGARFQRCLPWAGMFRAFSASAASRR